MLRIIKVIFGGAFLLFAIVQLVYIINHLLGKTGADESDTAFGMLKSTFFLVLFGGAAIFFLYSAFRRPKLMTPVNPPL